MRQDPRNTDLNREKLNTQETENGKIQFYSSLNMAECIESDLWLDLGEWQ